MEIKQKLHSRNSNTILNSPTKLKLKKSQIKILGSVGSSREFTSQKFFKTLKQGISNPEQLKGDSDDDNSDKCKGVPLTKNIDNFAFQTQTKDSKIFWKDSHLAFNDKQTIENCEESKSSDRGKLWRSISLNQKMLKSIIQHQEQQTYKDDSNLELIPLQVKQDTDKRESPYNKNQRYLFSQNHNDRKSFINCLQTFSPMRMNNNDPKKLMISFIRPSNLDYKSLSPVRSPVRADSTRSINVQQIIDQINAKNSAQLSKHPINTQSTRDLKFYLENEFNVPQAAALKKQTQSLLTHTRDFDLKKKKLRIKKVQQTLKTQQPISQFQKSSSTTNLNPNSNNLLQIKISKQLLPGSNMYNEKEIRA
ncbi:UNKNOWN [Stylonychia lemnae]|uniref:Uncharacterized protein n=1 Tax=Stylonychia lemnae TaxID=5949 RepID=A0A078ACK4_STYLE|nr:UNKNOWN [Stylonychia lemnae]|eukprot:CDW79596.1 UNKNOWN [Stylonychia lemnae]